MAVSTRQTDASARTQNALSFGARGVALAAVALAAVGVVAALTLGNALAAPNAVNVTDVNYPAGTTAVADASTMDSYKLYPTNNQETSFDTTQYAGRLWTDKTVVVPEGESGVAGTTATFNLADPSRDLDPTGERTDEGVFQVDKTASGTFLTSVSVLSSSLTTELVEPVPLDIVLVLDVSGSMDERYQYTYNVYNSNSAPQYTSPSYGDDYTYYVLDNDGKYYRINGNRQGSGNAYYYTADNGPHTRYYYTNSNNTAGSNYNNNQNYQYSRLYRRATAGNTKMADLKTAVGEFVDTIALNNSRLYNDGYNASSMSRISLVKFAYFYYGDNSFDGTPNWSIGNGNAGGYNATQIVSDLTTYTPTAITGTSSAASTLKTTVNGLNASGATAADCGLTLAQGVLDGGHGSLVGARNDAKRVVIFFTDGKPTQSNGFNTSVATNAVNIAGQMKDDDVLVYSVVIADGASTTSTINPTFTSTSNLQNSDSTDINPFLQGVSSNYPDASAVYSNNSWILTMGNKETSNYYLVASESSLSDAFASIASDISSGGGEDTTATGRDGNTAITITDYLGDYMEFKGLDGILYGTAADATNFYAPGTQGAYHTQAQVQRDDASATQSTYTMWAPVPSALLNPPEGQENVNLNLITVKVTRSTDPKTGDTVTITIPPELIPSLRYEVEQKQSGNTITTTSMRDDADPLRIFYSVGPKASTASNVISQIEDQSLRSEDATNEVDRQSEAFLSFMADAARDGQNGVYKLYNNTPTTTAQGTATVDMTLSTSNPYYFYVDEPLYTRTGAGTQANPYVYSKAASGSTGTLYARTRYWTVGANPTETNDYVAWSGSSGTWQGTLYTYDEGTESYSPATASSEGQLYKAFVPTGSTTPSAYEPYNGAFADWSADGVLYIPNGTPRTDANVTNVVMPKSEDNGGATETATTSLTSTFAGGTTATQHLGNNGLLSIPIKGTLATTKNIKAGTGFDLPTDPVPAFEFTLSLKGADDTALTQENTYRALIRDAAGHPIDPVTHTPASSADSVKFYVTDGSTFVLRDGETIKVTNLPHNATYTVTETGQPGYAATVTDNTGVSQEPAERGASASTLPAAGAGD